MSKFAPCIEFKAVLGIRINWIWISNPPRL